jgi:GWxTD domain-containing protein
MRYLSKIFELQWRHWAVVILAPIVLIFSSSQAQPPLKPNLDAAQFQDKSGQSYLEIYYSLPEAAIKYVPDVNGTGACRLLLALQIYHDSKLWASKSWKIEKTFAGTPKLQNARHLVDVLSYLVETPGRYRIALQVRDLNRTDRTDSAGTEIEVRHFSPQEVEISDLELASAIRPRIASSSAVFTKYAQEVIPNAMTLFGEGAPELYYYFEAYHLLQNVPGRKYKTLCRIHNPDGAIVENLGSAFRTKTKRFDASVEIGMMNIANLPSGKYRLVYGIADSAETVLASREKTFFVYNPSIRQGQSVNGAELLQTASGPLHDLDEKALDDEFAKMIYLSTPNDRKFYKNLSNAEAKREYILSLWQSAPANDALNPLAYRQQYLARAEYADQRYKTPNRSGWKTDRGRVTILYGAPSHIERSPNSSTTLPYETWTYDNLKGQGGVVFIFADRMGFSNYEQVHSTLQGELQDPNWQQLITRSSSGENRPGEMQ